MKIQKPLMAVLATLALSAGPAQAATYNLSGLQAGSLVNPGSFTATVNASAADVNAKLDFVLTGFSTLDGHNSYEDVFTLTINGGTPISGSFDLGGGGTSDLTFGGVTAVTTSSFGAGGTTTVSGLTFNLLFGVNNFVFAYSAPGPANGGGQGLGDEGWGIRSASVTAVPEPETYAMLLAGLGLMGTIARRRKSEKA